MKIIVNNVEFPFNEGCKLLKLKHGLSSGCPFKEIEEFWNDIEPLTFKEIITVFKNVEQRRIGLLYLGLENLSKEIKSTLVSSETISKETTWTNKVGIVETVPFDDKYELYSVSGEELLGDPSSTIFHYVKFKDTSTLREYLLWIDYYHIYRLKDYQDVTAIDAIAWTIQTNLKEGGIEKIIRQGDCILLKKNKSSQIGDIRHLTGNEYRALLVLES
jgi:DNA-binding transcriptional ArsR family regulator